MGRAKGLKFIAKKFCRQASRPFIQISQHQPGMIGLRLRQNIFFQQSSALMASFHVTRSQVNIKNPQSSAIAEQQIGLQHSPFLSPAVRKVVIAPCCEREASQSHISIAAPVEGSVAAEDPRVLGEFLCNLLRLIELRWPERSMDDLLETQNIRIELPNHLKNALRRYLSVKPTAFMDVISCDPELLENSHFYCCRSKIHPRISVIR